MLGNLAIEARVDTDAELCPHRPIAVTLKLSDGDLVPVQKVTALRSNPKRGPRRAPPSYARVRAKLGVLKQPGSLDKVGQENPNRS